MISADKKRVFISLNLDLVEFLEHKAWLEKMTKSQVVEMLLKEMQKNDKRKSK